MADLKARKIAELGESFEKGLKKVATEMSNEGGKRLRKGGLTIKK